MPIRRRQDSIVSTEKIWKGKNVMRDRERKSNSRPSASGNAGGGEIEKRSATDNGGGTNCKSGGS